MFAEKISFLSLYSTKITYWEYQSSHGKKKLAGVPSNGGAKQSPEKMQRKEAFDIHELRY